MARLPPSRVAVHLGLILFLGTLARVPGLFWGYRLFGTETIPLPDEPLYAPGRLGATGYPRGLATSVRLVTFLLEHAGLTGVTGSGDYGFFVGRVVSLIYGLLTLVVVFRLARSFFQDERVGLLAAFFLSLADLHVTYSHVGIPDSPATFWFYAALASAHTALTRQSRQAFLLSSVATGAAAAMRFQLTSLLPLLWWVGRSRARVVNGCLLLTTVPAAAFLASGLSFDPAATRQLLMTLVTGRDPGPERLFLPLAYMAVLVVGVGLPVFLLASYGFLRFLRAKWTVLRRWRDIVADNQLPLCLAPLAAFLQMSIVGPWAHRYAVILTPFVAMLAAYGFTHLPHRALGPLSERATARGLLALIGVYLTIQVTSVQAYFADSPLEKAGRWLRTHVPAGEALSTLGAEAPPEYPRIQEWKANYLLVSPKAYPGSQVRDSLRARPTNRAPTTRRVSSARGEEARRVQQLLRGELPYGLVKQIRLRFYTPELLLAHALWYPPPHLDDVLIYERHRELERSVELLTPSRTDYLITLDTGRLWRLEPGQQVRVLVNDHSLGARLGQGITHLLLPRTLIGSPHSRLRLSSDHPLPHLPVEFVTRIRPLGPEFVVESLLDEDLMPEGFSGPEVEADGAARRWTDGAGRILLPHPGESGPWRRLAVRLAGRPGDAPSAQPVVLALNSRKVGDTVISGEERTIEVPVPAGAFTADVTTLEITTPAWRPTNTAGSADPRRPGAAVYWVRLTRSQGFQPFSHRIQFQWFHHRAETVSFPSGGLTLKADLFVPTGGGRSAILLAHGANPLGRKHALYLGLGRRLAEHGYWVLSPDFRGYGESQDPSRIATPGDLDFTQDLVSAVTFLQNRVGVKDVTVVGHSFGAGVAVALAARDPRVGRVVAISPGRRTHERVLSSPEGRLRLRNRMISEMGLREEQFPVELVEPIVVPMIIDTYAEHPFRQPILLIDGEREDPEDLRFLRDLHRRLRADRAYITLPNADHYFGVEQRSDERNPVVLGSLADVIDGWIREGAHWSRPAD